MVRDVQDFRLVAHQMIALDRLRAQDDRLAVPLQPDEQLPAYLHRRGAVRYSLFDIRQLERDRADVVVCHLRRQCAGARAHVVRRRRIRSIRPGAFGSTILISTEPRNAEPVIRMVGAPGAAAVGALRRMSALPSTASTSFSTRRSGGTRISTLAMMHFTSMTDVPSPTNACVRSISALPQNATTRKSRGRIQSASRRKCERIASTPRCAGTCAAEIVG